MIVYLTRYIPPFVMYWINGKPRSSLLIESTDSMITHTEDEIVGDLYLFRILKRVLQIEEHSWVNIYQHLAPDLKGVFTAYFI